MRWLRGLRFDDLCSQATFIDYLSGGRDARRSPRGAGRRARAGDPRQPPRDRRSRGCVAFAGSTRSRPPGCAPRSATGSASGPSSCRGFSGSSRPSTPPTPSAARARSPRPDRRTPAGCWSRPPTTTATGPPSATSLARRQHGQDPRVIEIAWRAQRRLHQRWQVLRRQRRKPAGVVAIACARELAAFCWEAATLD